MKQPEIQPIDGCGQQYLTTCYLLVTTATTGLSFSIDRHDTSSMQASVRRDWIKCTCRLMHLLMLELQLSSLLLSSLFTPFIASPDLHQSPDASTQSSKKDPVNSCHRQSIASSSLSDSYSRCDHALASLSFFSCHPRLYLNQLLP